MKHLLFYLTILTICSCNSSIDYQNPESVIKAYRTLRDENKIKESYELLSDTSKGMMSIEEYLKYFKRPDSILNKWKYKTLKSEALINDPAKPNYRLVRISEQLVYNNKDTTIGVLNYTLIKENQKWKVIWFPEAIDDISRLINDQRFEEAKQKYFNLLNIDPFNDEVLYQISTCYYYKNDLDSAESYLKKSIFYIEDDFKKHNLLAAIYYKKGKSDLARECLKKALTFAKQNRERAMIYSNLVEYDFQNSDYAHLWNTYTLIKLKKIQT